MDLRKVSHFLRKIRGVPYCGAVIVAAGNASRMEGIDKILAPLEGIPVIQRTAQAFQDCAVIREVVIVTREDRILPVKQLCAGMDKVTAVIAGGSSRQDSVAMGLGGPGRTGRTGGHSGWGQAPGHAGPHRAGGVCRPAIWWGRPGHSPEGHGKARKKGPGHDHPGPETALRRPDPPGL